MSETLIEAVGMSSGYNKVALVREAVLQFPEPRRTRYQLLYEKALGASR